MSVASEYIEELFAKKCGNQPIPKINARALQHKNTRKNVAKLRDAAFEKQKGQCYYCKRQMQTKTSLDALNKSMMVTAEHLTPISKGGRNNHKNIVAACRKCNNKRGNTELKEFLVDNLFGE